MRGGAGAWGGRPNRAEEIRAEQSSAEQRRAEQCRAVQSRAELSTVTDTNTDMGMDTDTERDRARDRETDAGTDTDTDTGTDSDTDTDTDMGTDTDTDIGAEELMADASSGRSPSGGGSHGGIQLGGGVGPPCNSLLGACCIISPPFLSPEVT